jgi:hypothetical protein
MATKPTRLQEHGCDRLAEALRLITEAARADGKGNFEASDLAEVIARLAKVSSAFDRDQIVARALQQRARALGLRSDTADLLTLLDAEIQPPEMLLLSDDAFRELVEKLEQELGEI